MCLPMCACGVVVGFYECINQCVLVVHAMDLRGCRWTGQHYRFSINSIDFSAKRLPNVL